MLDEIDPGLARLIAAHPAIFRGRAPAVESYLSEGWYSLVDELCSDIERAIDADDLEQFECRQIKEKFGTLRFYWRLGSPSLPHIDVLTAGDFVSFEISPTETDRRIEIVSELVEAACSASATVCEVCGRPGRLLTKGGYCMTRCYEHASRQDAADDS